MTINLSLFALPFITASLKYKRLDTASKIMAVLMGISFLGECTAAWAAFHYHNNYPVYAILDIFEQATLCLYFNACIPLFNRYRIGFYLAALSIIVGIVNLAFFQPARTFDSNYLNYETVLTVLMAFTSLMGIILKDQGRLFTSPHFWFALILIVFWCTTFPAWGLYDMLTDALRGQKFIIDHFIMIVCCICNIGDFLVFLLLAAKMKSHDDR